MRRFVAGALAGLSVSILMASFSAAPQAQGNSLPPIFVVGTSVYQGSPRFAAGSKIVEVNGEWIRFGENAEMAEFGKDVWVHAPTGTTWHRNPKLDEKK